MLTSQAWGPKTEFIVGNPRIDQGEVFNFSSDVLQKKGNWRKHRLLWKEADAPCSFP